ARAADGLLDLVLLGQGDVVVALDARLDGVVDPDRVRGGRDGACDRGGEQSGANPAGSHGAVRGRSVDVVEDDASQLLRVEVGGGLLDLVDGHATVPGHQHDQVGELGQDAGIGR